MNKLSSYLAMFKEATFELPFFIFLTLALTAIGVYTMVSSPALQDPGRAVAFAILLVVHILLYWLAVIVARTRSQMLTYIAIQGLLVFVLNLLGQHSILPLGLTLGVVGITVGMLKLSRWSLGAVAFLLALSLISYGMENGWQNAAYWVLAVVPMGTFVVIYVFLYIRQAEARAKAQALADELEQANRKLAESAARVEELTLTNERQRMARELHDTLSQGLAGLILQLEAVDAHLGSGRSQRAQAIVEQAMQQARATLADARAAIGGLRQEPADAAGLEDVLRQETERFSSATAIPCQLEMELPPGLPPALGEVVQKALAEGLSNIARHAHASQAWVRLAAEGGCLELSLGDDGVGFDPQSVQPGHYGLLGMQERARLAGGTLEVQSEAGKGARVILRLPLAHE